MQKEKKKGAPGMRGRDLPMGGYDWDQIFWFRFRERCIVPQNTGAFHIGCAPPLPPLHGLNSFQQRAKPSLRNAHLNYINTWLHEFGLMQLRL